MTLSEAKAKYVFTTRIELDDGEFIVMREPNLSEYQKFSATDDTKNLEQIKLIFPKCIVESSFTDENGNQASGQQIYEMLSQSATSFTGIMEKWLTSCPFQSHGKKNKN